VFRKKTLIVAVYVDNILLCELNKNKILGLKIKLSDHFKMTDYRAYKHYLEIEWPSGFFKAGFSLILHALLAMSNHSGRNFKNLNKTSVVCIELESDLFFAILGSFCREL